jgi:hypothetical protein
MYFLAMIPCLISILTAGYLVSINNEHWGWFLFAALLFFVYPSKIKQKD